MRDAELRFATLRMRIQERTGNAARRGRDELDVALRHPGDAKVTTSRPGALWRGEYEVWISDGELVRTYAGGPQARDPAADPQPPARPRRPGLPGLAQVYEPVTALPFETLPDTFVHPAGFCQNVLATGRCTVTGTELVTGREAILLAVRPPAHDRARRRPPRLTSLASRSIARPASSSASSSPSATS